MALTQKTTDIEQLQTQRIGYMAVSLTHYDDDSEPAIAEGSVIELAGALYEAGSDESISGWGGIGNDTDVYIKINGSAAAEFTTTAPTWDTAKQGWYGTGAAATHRYVGGLYKDASGNYTDKWLYRGGPDIRHGAMGADAIATGSIQDRAVTTAKLDDLSVTAGKLDTDSVSKGKLGPWSQGSSGSLGAGENWGTVDGLLWLRVTAGGIDVTIGTQSFTMSSGDYGMLPDGAEIAGTSGTGGTFYMRRLWE